MVTIKNSHGILEVSIILSTGIYNQLIHIFIHVELGNNYS